MDNILEFLERTATKYPSRIAVDDGEVTLTWKELLFMSQRIGTAIQTYSKMGNPVAILKKKSAVTLATMFGTVYAGCFYVMIDPEQPKSRMENILNVLEPALVIAEDAERELVEAIDSKIQTVKPKSLMETEIDLVQMEKIRKKSKRSDLLYGIFTSGSTGIPKGITVSHGAVIDFISHFVDTFDFQQKDRIGNQAPFDFDVSVKDIYTSVMTGASLILIPKEYFSMPSRLLDFLCEKEISVIIWAVSALSLVSALKGLSYKVPVAVKKILFSGEVMPVKQLRIWQKALPDTEFVNLYGPSEITCNCTYFRVDRIYDRDEKVPIGKAFAGRKVFLIDENGNEITQPKVSGEICVVGESISEGYYHNEEETRKHFVLFPQRENARGYKTGDLGYYGTDELLYFAGRKDFQIKHMGHRIELEEIERAMEQVEGLERCCCIMDEKRNKIVAFYLGNVPSDEIRRQMKQRVPVYMVPQKMVEMTVFPLNKNGKTDRAYFKQQLEVKKNG